MSDGHNNTEEDMEDGKYVGVAYFDWAENSVRHTDRCDVHFFFTYC